VTAPSPRGQWNPPQIVPVTVFALVAIASLAALGPSQSWFPIQIVSTQVQAIPVEHGSEPESSHPLPESAQIGTNNTTKNPPFTTVPLRGFPDLVVSTMVYDTAKGEMFVGVLPTYECDDGCASDVDVVSDLSDSVVAAIPVGNYIISMAFDSARGDVFVATGESPISTAKPVVDVISDANNSVVATVPTIYSEDLFYDSAIGEVFAISSSGIAVINDTSDTLVSSTLVNPAPEGYDGFAFDSHLGDLFLINGTSNQDLAVYSTHTNTVIANLAGGDLPSALVYDDTKEEMFVLDSSGSVRVMSDTTYSLVATAQVGAGASSEYYDGGVGEVFVGTNDIGNVSVINDSTDDVSATVPVPYPTAGYFCDATSWGVLFLSGTTTTVLNVSTNSVAATLPAGNDFVGAVYDSGTDEVYLVNSTNADEPQNLTLVPLHLDVGAAASATQVTSTVSDSFRATPVGGTWKYVSFEWFFGNGATSTAQNPVYTYPSPGWYSASVIVTDSDGKTAVSNVVLIHVASTPSGFLNLPGNAEPLILAALIVGSIVVVAVIAIDRRARPMKGPPERATDHIPETIAATAGTGAMPNPVESSPDDEEDPLGDLQ
jgi:PKD repeat protein